MNHKILAVLFICPVAIFAADKMIGIAGNSVRTNERTSPTSEIHINSIVSNEELVTEMKASIKDRKGREKAFDQTEHEGLWSDKMNEVQRNFISMNVVKKLEKKNICTIDLERSFSRCPSGYDAVVIVKNNQITNEGWMTAQSGCSDEPIAMFRYDINAKTIEAKVSDKVGYVPLDEFFKIYKTASASI